MTIGTAAGEIGAPLELARSPAVTGAEIVGAMRSFPTTTCRGFVRPFAHRSLWHRHAG